MRSRLLIISVILLLIVVAVGAKAQTVEGVWDRANTLYINGDYQEAIDCYDSLLNAGNVSEKLYYNLGNAYFKEKKIGKAILYYNKALKLAPTDSDTRHNLLVAGGYVKDKIEVMPEFFLKRWFHDLRKSLSANTWAIISLITLAMTLAMVMLYLLSRNFTRRKIGFFGAIIALVMTIYAVSAASIEKRDLLHPSHAIIMHSAVPVKSSPNQASTDIFVLHEGTNVKIVGSIGDWSEIMIADGNKGWVLNSAIEMI